MWIVEICKRYRAAPSIVVVLFRILCPKFNCTMMQRNSSKCTLKSIRGWVVDADNSNQPFKWKKRKNWPLPITSTHKHAKESNADTAIWKEVIGVSWLQLRQFRNIKFLRLRWRTSFSLLREDCAFPNIDKRFMKSHMWSIHLPMSVVAAIFNHYLAALKTCKLYTFLTKENKSQHDLFSLFRQFRFFPCPFELVTFAHILNERCNDNVAMNTP